MKGMLTKDMFDGIPEIQYAVGYRYFLGNNDNYAHALMSILKSIKSKLPILQTMIITQEYVGLKTITQTLRKMLSNIGAEDISETTYLIETMLLNDDRTCLQEQLYSYVLMLVDFADRLETLLQGVDMKSVTKRDENNSNYLNYDFTKTKESIKLSSNLLERKII
jgi:HPt (histidine-containing phosphotransfer) domain-containing protein